MFVPRFVILRHETPPESERPVHWDLMLEAGDVLRTWALELEPHPGASIAAWQLPDHRKAYLDYEGPISNNRGHVTRCDAGTYEIESETPTQLTLLLAGQTLAGTVILRRDEKTGQWL